MNFEEVIPLLRALKWVRCKEWTNYMYYIKLNPDNKLVDMDNCYYHDYHDDDIFARSDWEEFKEEPKPISTETIEWFRIEDKQPENGRCCLCYYETIEGSGNYGTKHGFFISTDKYKSRDDSSLTASFYIIKLKYWAYTDIAFPSKFDNTTKGK